MFVMVPRAAARPSASRRSSTPNRRSATPRLRPRRPSRDGFVEFRDVEFRYPGAEDPVLRGISFTARPGETTAIIGSTGSGQVHAHQPDPALLRRHAGSVQRRRRRRPGHAPGGPVAADRLRPAEGVPVQRHGREQPPLRRRVTPTTSPLARARGRPGQGLRRRDARRPRRRRSPRAAPTSPAASGSASRSRARSSRSPKIYVFDDSFSALDFKTDSATARARSRRRSPTRR